MAENLMFERLELKIKQKQEELTQLEEAAKAKKRELNELLYIRGGSERGAEEAVAALQNGNGTKRKYTKKSDNNNGDVPRHGTTGMKITPWTDDEDRIIMSFIEKAGAVTIGEAASQALPRLQNRTDGAARQRIMKLVERGFLKRKSNGTGPLTVEVRKKMEAAA